MVRTLVLDKYAREDLDKNHPHYEDFVRNWMPNMVDRAKMYILKEHLPKEKIIPDKCPCGRTHRRIEPITHRIDDMLIINGVNVFPSQIEECIYKHLSTATNYLIHVVEKDGLKKLLIDIELPNDLLNNVEGLKVLEKELISTMKAYITITPKLNFIPIGTLPEIQGKAKRVVKD